MQNKSVLLYLYIPTRMAKVKDNAKLDKKLKLSEALGKKAFSQFIKPLSSVY